MEITITRFVSFEHDGSLKAFCDVSIGSVVLIKGVRIVEGKKGPFVSMPRQLSRNGKWYDSIVPLTKEVKTSIHEAVLAAYERELRLDAGQERRERNARGVRTATP